MIDPAASHINLLDPINRAHPLAQGLVGWWKALPVRMGTATWFDLAQGLVGTLTAITPAAAWGDTTRSGGYGELRLDGTGYVTCGNNPTVDVSGGSFSIGCWVKFNALTTNTMILAKDNGTLSTQYNVNLNTTIDFRTSTSGGNVVVHPGNVTPTTGVWYHVLATYDGVAMEVYTSGVASGHPQPQTGTVSHISQAFEIGSRNGGTLPLNGSFDDVMFWTRGLTAGEALMLMYETSAGCPDLLSWSTPGFVAFPATAESFVKTASGLVVVSLAASATLAATKSATATVVLSTTAVGVTHLASAVSSAVVRATAAVTAVTASGSASASAVLRASAVGIMVRHAASSVVVRAMAAAVRAAVAQSSAVVVMRARASVPGRAVLGTEDYLGRYQVGQEVPIWVQCFFGSGLAGPPDGAPVLRLYRDGVFLGRCAIAALDGSPGRFGGGYLLTDLDGPGRYAALLSYVTGGEVRVQLQVFEVLAGGDVLGPTIAIHSVGRPDGDQLLVQSGTGRLLLGRSFYVDEGV